MEWFQAFTPFIGPFVMVILTVIILPYLRRLYRLHKEQVQMIKKKLFENTGVVIFGHFDGKVQSDYLGGFPTALFGETLFDLIVEWNDEPSPSIIVPGNPYQSDHLQEILAAHASPFILQSKRIDCYFQDVEEHGTPSYKFAKFVVCLARPDAEKLTCHDYPRIMIVEESNLRKIMDEQVLPQYDTVDGHTWLDTIRELGRKYFDRDHSGIAVLEVPVHCGVDSLTQ